LTQNQLSQSVDVGSAYVVRVDRSNTVDLPIKMLLDELLVAVEPIEFVSLAVITIGHSGDVGMHGGVVVAEVVGVERAGNVAVVAAGCVTLAKLTVLGR
jgi:hypothetical protein